MTRELIRSEIGAKEVECVADYEKAERSSREVEEERRGAPLPHARRDRRLADLGRSVERHYGGPQDLEWAIDRGLDEVFLLQARPETVWSQKRKTVAAESPLAAIAATFMGGRRGLRLSDGRSSTPEDVKEILRLRVRR